MHKNSGLTQRSFLAGLLALFVIVLAACGGSNSTSTTPSAQQLISSAQAAIQKVSSYHFNLKVDNLGANSDLPIQTADGDLLVPDKLKANAKALFLGSIVQVQLISIGDKEYVTNPVTNAWQPTTGLLDARSLTDPQTGIAGILGHIQNPSTPGDDNVDGTSCWRINGKMDAKYLSGITGANRANAGTIVDFSTCIGKSDNLPYQFIITGAAAKGDTTTTKRTFKLSKFNENLTITAPI